MPPPTHRKDAQRAAGRQKAAGRGEPKAAVKVHRLVLTGVTGTLGRNLLEELRGWRRCEVLALARESSELDKELGPLNYRRINFFDQKAIAAALQEFRPTCVVHCAASGMRFLRPAWFDMVRFNVDASLNLCESVSRIPGCQFIYISTGLAYRDQGRPLREEDALDTQHPYGASKAAADILVRSAAAEFGVPLTVFRPFSFSGLGDSSSRLVPSLLSAAAAKEPFELTGGDQVRDHCAASDIAHGIALSIQQGPSEGQAGRVFNLGSGSSEPLRPLIERVVRELDLDVSLQFGVRPLTKFEPKHLVADITAARAGLNWRPQRNFAFAVWQLARESFPSLRVRRPREWLS
jgi:UDP-glucose 4-epimerase